MTEMEATQSDRLWIVLLNKLINLPKWCFGFLGYVVEPEEVNKTLSGEIVENISTVTEKIVNTVEVVEEPDSNVIVVLLDGLFNTLLSNFPATLSVGPMNQDMSIVSVVLLSGFIACLTSVFIIFLNSLFLSKNLKEKEIIKSKCAKADFRRKRHYQKSDIAPASLATAQSNVTFQLPQKAIFENDYALAGDDCLNENYFPNEMFRDVGAEQMRLLTLHQFSRGKYSPCFDMHGMKVETLLRLAHIPYEVIFDCSHTGPCITRENEAVWGMKCIMKFLKENYADQMHIYGVHDDLKIQSHLINLHIEQEICWLLYHWRWFFGIHNTENNFSWSKIPPEFTELAAASWNRKLGNVTIDVLVEQLEESFSLLSRILGDNEYFLDNVISEVDISVFSVLSQAIWAMPTTTVEGLILGKRNLVNLCYRIRRLCWSDWDDQLWKEQKHEHEMHAALKLENIKKQELKQERTRTRIFKRKYSTLPHFSPPEIPDHDTVFQDSAVQTTILSSSKSDSLLAYSPPNNSEIEIESGGDRNVGTSLPTEISQTYSKLIRIQAKTNFSHSEIGIGTYMEKSKSSTCMNKLASLNKTSSIPNQESQDDSEFVKEVTSTSDANINSKPPSVNKLFIDLLGLESCRDQRSQHPTHVKNIGLEGERNISNVGMLDVAVKRVFTESPCHGDQAETDSLLHLNNGSMSDSMLDIKGNSKIPVWRYYH